MAKHPTSPKQPPAAVQPGRRWLGWAIAIFAALVVTGVLIWPQIHGYALTGTAYGARVACSCRFVGGRPLGDCRKDFEPGMDLVTLSEDTAARSVTARFPLVARQTAAYREGWGCVLEPWQD